MRHLSIAEYVAKERAARVGASYPALRAFAPVSFERVQFPARVSDEQELVRYADIMHETLSRSKILDLKGYSETEARAVTKLAERVKRITKEHFGCAVQPLMCLFHPIPIVRAVEAIANARKRKLRIFEIGPGSGYLGAYLVDAGHAYVSMEITQALYLWQNRLFADISPEGSEWVLDEGVAAKCVHIPWWQYARYYKALPIRADIVICDAALAEMGAFGFHYNIRMAAQIVSGSDCAALLFQEVGEQLERSQDETQSDIINAGFAQSFAVGGVSLFSMPGRLDDVFAASVNDLPPLGKPGERLVAPRTFLPFNEEELLESYRFFKFLEWGM